MKATGPIIMKIVTYTYVCLYFATDGVYVICSLMSLGGGEEEQLLSYSNDCHENKYDHVLLNRKSEYDMFIDVIRYQMAF